MVKTIRYSAHREHSVIGRAFISRDGAGAPAAYNQIEVHLEAAPAISSPLDADGRFYFELLEPGTYEALIMDARGAHCTTRLRVPSFSGLQYTVGTFACVG